MQDLSISSATEIFSTINFFVCSLNKFSASFKGKFHLSVSSFYNLPMNYLKVIKVCLSKRKEASESSTYERRNKKKAPDQIDDTDVELLEV